MIDKLHKNLFTFTESTAQPLYVNDSRIFTVIVIRLRLVQVMLGQVVSLVLFLILVDCAHNILFGLHENYRIKTD